MDEENKEDYVQIDLASRKKKVIHYFKEKQSWVIVLLILAIIFGIYIRSLPMMDRNTGLPSFTHFLFNPMQVYEGRPGLWDITTNSWTLGPDLDPWLFLRAAQTIHEQGDLPLIDTMRNVPLGFDNSLETKLLPYMIVWTYKFLTLFNKNIPFTLAGVVLPVIMFVLTIVSFFLFVREVFIDETSRGRLRANAIALISTFFMIVIPIFLSRTVAGIPEKESAAFFFMFLSFYLFLRGWKSRTLTRAIAFGVGAGIMTGLMGLVWGGVIYAFIPLGAAGLIAFILDKVDKKEFSVYSGWVIVSFFILWYFTKRYPVLDLLTSLSSGICAFTLFVMIVHFVLITYVKKIHELSIVKNSHLPKTIISLIVAIILIIIGAVIVFGPSFLVEKVLAVHQTLFKPITGRWNITVAENKQPDFVEWSQNFGPFFKGIPLFFWLFIIGSIVLFRQLVAALPSKERRILIGLYILFLAGLIFSRYSSSSMFNGENFISKTFYYASLLIFVFGVGYYYHKFSSQEHNPFEQFSFSYILLFCLFVFTLFTARGAVRLIMVLGPIAPILASFLVVYLLEKFFTTKENFSKLVVGLIALVILIIAAHSFLVFYESTQIQSYYFVPSGYNVQWQKAMDWVRT
ncbi:MAG: STT3 domain-containing protein, partial [Nanoarchaeota archaeon]